MDEIKYHLYSPASNLSELYFSNEDLESELNDWILRR